ncbi:MAG TPA: DNA methyltransferase [Candidatus Acidoferrum sp.]|jgi:hypothetical protein|nr:DNA methyltransferase [Candidatus Acidoferrum sp.]
MTGAEFKTKWSRSKAKETASYQEHFTDLCRILGQKTPIEADPSGEDFFCFQKRVIKDLELFALHETPDEADPTERGFADVWKKGCFAWEYKGKKKNLEAAYKQLLRYREALLNPPLLATCDFDRYVIRTNFNGTVQESHEFTNDQIDRPENLRILRALFENPEYLKPQRTTAQVTERLAAHIAEVARSLQSRESTELADARTRREVRVAQKKNLRIARFLNRMVFCFFAEDTGLLPQNLFANVLKASLHDPAYLTEAMEQLFRVMTKGGLYGQYRIRHFNGHLFEDSTVFELTEEEIAKLAEAAEADWQFIQPSIMGNLFERGLDPDQRAQLGAHYTSEADILTLVEPVLMAPLRREWATAKSELARAFKNGKGTPAHRERLASFLKRISSTTVLDPACGSGNFLYVSLRLLLDLEKEVITFATQLGFKFEPKVGVQQLRAIELNAYAFELAQVSVQIGYLQWRRDNGFDNDRSPVLQNLDGFQNEDALLVPHFRSKAKTLKEAQAGEHSQDDSLKFYTERKWPEADAIVGNPPFLGGGMLRGQLGDAYVEHLFEAYANRIPGFSDLCCYWFEKARDLIERGECKRAGLLATQGIRGGANREVLKRIKGTGDIFFAISDRDWVLDGANVHVSIVGFDGRAEKEHWLDGRLVQSINANLTAVADITRAQALRTNSGICFMGPSPKAPFDFSESAAIAMLSEGGNVNGRPNSDVVRRVQSGVDLAGQDRRVWTLDFGLLKEDEASKYGLPFQRAMKEVKPIRAQRKSQTNRNWWQYERPRVELRVRLNGLQRFVATPEVAKHRIFVWRMPECLCNQQTLVFTRPDDCFFGILHSRFHEVWALAQGTQLREKESGFRYTPTTCFETFAFPFPTPEQEAAIAAVAKELNDLRERWLNPPEWTVENILEFSGTKGGPWDRYVDLATVDPKTGVGTVRYPRLEPRQADCAAKLKRRTLTNLYNERPTWLDSAHKKLDAAVASAYGWPADLTDHQILEKLLALNQERAAEEANAAKVKKPKASREKRHDEMI